MSDFPTRNALMIAKQMAPQGTPKMDFYDAKTYTPPVVPQRPITEDYKNGVTLDDRRNLSRTIEGRPLTAQVVAGRSTLGSSGIYPDRGIDPQTLKRLGTEAGGASFLESPAGLLKGAVGTFSGSRDPVTGDRKSTIVTRNDLSPEGGDNVRAHEVAHLFDWISGTLPVPSKGPVRDQMEQVYHHLATGKAPTPGYETKYGLVTPEAHGYSGKKADKELAAESIRSYLTNPNYLKTAAPKAAALIRKHFNDHPYLSKFLQFNSVVPALLGSSALALLGSSGIYADGGMVDEDTPNHSNITKASGGMIDDPAKSIRRAVMVAKGLAKEIGPLPTGDHPKPPHPASMIPGVHVTGMGDEHTAIPDGYADGGDVTSNPNFSQWFGNSVTHDNGVPRTYYTGTSKDKDFTSFNVGRHGAWFTTDPHEASQYAESNDSQGHVWENGRFQPTNTASRVIPAYLKAENPYTGERPEALSRAQNYKKAQSDWFDQLRAAGHDSWMPSSLKGNLAVMLRHPTQIKSAIGNSGAFDPKQKAIHRADGGSTPAWQRKEGQNPSGGLNSKAHAIHKDGGGDVEPTNETGFDAWHGMSDTPTRKALLIAKQVAPEDRKANLAAFMEGNHPLVPQVLYHGTDRDVRSFDAKAKPNFDSGSTPDDSDTGWYSKGFYLTPSRRVASFYADPQNKNRAGANVMPVHLSMKNPYVLNVPEYDSGALNMDKELDKLGAPKRKGFTWRLPSEQTAFLKSKGYDGVIMMRDGVPHEYIAHDPNQIKSAIGNQGTYSPNDPAIHKADGGDVEPTDETGFDAWHGTPHTFAPEPGAALGRFRSDNIGTGEGAEDFMSPEDIHAMAQAYHQHRSDGGVDRALQIARSHANGGGYQDAPFRHIEARSPGWGDTWTPLHEIQGKLKSPIASISDAAANFGDFMSGMAHKATTQGLAPRDLIKAYLMTISSQGRQAVNPETVLKNWPDYPGPTHGKIRPEGAMGEWLASPMGRRYLDAAEQGKVDPEAVQHALKSFNGFGFADSHEGVAMPWAAQTLVPHTKMVSDMIAESVKGRHSSEDWRQWVKKNVKGVGFAKAGFFASMLGRGDQPVPDARQLVLNTPEGSGALEKIGSGGSSAPSTLREGEAIDRLAARQRALSLAHPKALAPYYQSLAHHTIWDAASGTDTTHQDVIDAMRHAASGGLIDSKDEHPVVTIMKRLGMPGLHDQEQNPQKWKYKNGGNAVTHALFIARNAIKR